MAKIVASHLKVFHYATSLGGVESLVDYRFLVDPKKSLPVDLRLSIGIEGIESLMEDLDQAISLSLANNNKSKL